MRDNKVITSLSLALVCGLVGPPALADVATATLNWAQLQSSAVGLGGQPAPNLSSAISPNTTQTSAASTQGQPDETDNDTRTTSNWTGTNGTSATTQHAQSSTFASTFLVTANAFSSVSAQGDNTFGFNSASGTVDRRESLTVDGAGAVFFSVPYQLFLQSTDPFFTQAQVSGFADFTSFDGTASGHGQQIVSFTSGPSSGILTFGIVASGPGNISLDFQALANSTSFGVQGTTLAAVPEPSSFAGLCAGLFALGAFARRRLKSG